MQNLGMDAWKSNGDLAGTILFHLKKRDQKRYL